MNNENYNAEDCMGWEDEIVNDGAIIILEEGDYPFEVVDMERERTSGTGKLPPCNRAALKLRVATKGGGHVDVKCDLILHRSLEWKISSFFRSIGQKKHGESMTMDWDSVVGATGYAHFKPDDYVRDGRTYQKNAVTKFLDPPEPVSGPEAPSAAEDIPFAPVNDDDEFPFN